MLFFIENILTMKYRKRNFLWIQYLKAGRLFETNHEYLYCHVNVNFKISNSGKITDRNKKQSPKKQLGFFCSVGGGFFELADK